MITHDSWQRIKEIFQSAQKLSGAERSDFLDGACGDDQSIREEVEALLTADASNEDFLNAPAYEFAASILVESEFSAGQKIGSYTILCPLGSGGMGQIYLAEDAKLRRKIALKLISQQFASDPRRVNRFEQEALAASALNHPNICVIHELGIAENGRHFIAMEYIQGITLREKLSRESLSIPQAVNIAVQVATALSSAHASGIVHRDIKPENLMLRPDGYVKVLDFGLAKLTEILSEPAVLHEVSANVRTEAGTLMGTVKYMSPEQLRETKIDERSDIWSLGVVLYETLTGATPFEGQTSNDTVAAILARQSTPLEFAEHIPGQLRYIVSKALEKERDRRYQTITKFAADLKELQGKLQGQPTIDVAPVSPYSRDEQQTRKIEHSGIFTRIKSQALLTTDFLLSEIRSHKTAALFTGISGVLVFLLLLPTAVRFANKFISSPIGTHTSEVNSVTNAGTSFSAAFSSDGKSVAHVEEQDGKQRLVVTNTETSASYEVVPAAEAQYLGLSFTRDNNYLYYTRKENGVGILYRLALPASKPTKVLSWVDSPISFSPQEDRFAFVRLDQATSEYSLVVANIDGSNEQVLTRRKGGERLSVYGLAWAPDDSLIICPTSSWTDHGYFVNLIGIDPKNNTEHRIGSDSWFAILQLAWEADMNSLVVSARDQPTKPFQLWRVNYPDGARRQITADLAEYRGVSLAGRNIVSVRIDRSWELVVASAVNNYAGASSITSGVGLSYGLNWAGSERLIFSAMAQTKLNISRINADGSDLVRLTTNTGDNYTPAASADGRYVVFSSNRDGHFNLWRMNADDGSDLKQLTFTDANFYPSISPDDHWVAYDNQQLNKKSVWRVPLQGGPSTRVAEKYRMPAYSPDGQFLAARYDLNSGSRDVAIFSSESGEPLRFVEIPILEWQRVQWLSNHTFSYIKNVDGEANIWSYDLNTRSTKQLTNFNRDQIFAYAWSPDYKRLACQLGTRMGNVVMLKSDRSGD
jgi:serine/threonine protein kinase